MPTIDELLKEFPEPVASTIRGIWGALPDESRMEIEGIATLLPKDMRGIKDIFSEVLAHQKTAFLQDKQKIAIVGPANVGKSTLYNQLITHKGDRAAVSPVPGTTRQNQLADAGLFNVIDTPGVSASGQTGVRERELAFQAASGADFLVILFDAAHGIQQDESQLFGELKALGKPYIVALNKVDLVPDRDLPGVIQAAAAGLGLEPAQIITIQATNGKDVDRVVLAITKAEPRLLMAVAAALPEYRARLAWQRITAAGTAAAGVALVPLPIADVIPLLGIQTGLVLTIARIYGFNITLGRAKEIIATFGLGFAARMAFEELSKLGGLPGWILSASIAASTTVAMGYASILWFGHGERPSQDVLRKATQDIAIYLKDQLADLREKKPGQGTLRQRVSQALEDLPKNLGPGR